jgi:hypothetical protein
MAAAALQTAPVAPANAERVETGQFRAPAGAVEQYRIRLLPVSSFPDLPPAVAAQLHGRRCMIPQSFEAQGPENVIHGAFRSAGSNDWAALCSSLDVTTLYVFFAGQFDSPIPLRSQPDTAWLGAEPGSDVFGSAWGISTRSLADLQSSRLAATGIAFDHDAIEDANLERSITVRYCDAGRWIALHPRAEP